MDLQFIGADLGRGFVKGYTEFDGKAKSCLFKSIIGEGRQIDYSKYDEPLHLNINGSDLFIGELAEKESYNPINNYSDDKTSEVAEKLLYAALYELADSEFVKVCIGVPYKSFKSEVLNEVANKYNGKQIKIINKITGHEKVVNIVRVDIFRESDAALFHVINNHPNRTKIQGMKNGMVTVGFRTTELAYFDNGMKFNDKLSDTKEIGNRTVLDVISKVLTTQGITKTLNEIDNDKTYNELKNVGYKNLVERINQDIEMSWINWREMNIFVAGGTSLNFDTIPSKFQAVKEPQMATAKGLYYIAEKRG